MLNDSRTFNYSIISLIILNVIAVCLQTVESFDNRYSEWLYYFEVFSVIIFTIEYLARIWTCTLTPKFDKPLAGRMYFLVQPMTLIDMIAILPFYIPFLGIDLRIIRILRIFRIFRIAKLGRYYNSLNLISVVLKKRREELVITTMIMAMIVFIAATLMYYAENDAQPAVFSSIPASMWFTIVTLTTIGYGDVTPLTPLGKIIASMIAVLGVGMVALPIAVLGAGFVEEIRLRKNRNRCPHCGKDVNVSPES